MRTTARAALRPAGGPVWLAVMAAGIGCGMPSGGEVDAPVDFAFVLEHARRADAAYLPDETIRARFGPEHPVAVSDLAPLDVRAFVEHDEARRIQWIAVRGTANLANVEEDADYDKRFAERLGAPVHHGFMRDAHAVWSFARPLLRDGYETRVTGHSLGGAVAAVVLMRLRVDGVRLGRSVTFGQPKVTTEEGVARYRELPLLRVVNHDDPVPLLPWETPGAVRGGLFRHFGRELWLDDKGTWELFAEHQAERYRLTSFLERLGQDDVLEHKMDRYLARLEKIAADAPASR